MYVTNRADPPKAEMEAGCAYVRTLPGIFGIMQIVVAILIIVCLVFVPWTQAHTYLYTITGTSIIPSFIFLVKGCCHCGRSIYWTIAEIIASVLWLLLFFLGALMTTTAAAMNENVILGIAAVLCLVDLSVLCAIFSLAFKAWRPAGIAESPHIESRSTVIEHQLVVHNNHSSNYHPSSVSVEIVDNEFDDDDSDELRTFPLT